MKNKLFYILGLSTAMLSSCHDDDMADMFLNGKEKTPLPVSVSLDTRGSVQTRAADKSFAVDDELLVYIQHMNGTSSVDADMAPALVKFKVTSDAMTEVDANTQETSNLELKSILHEGAGTDLKQAGQTTLYWDDFSDNSIPDKDLRTENHGLRPLYGYCYNGGNPTTALSPTEGTLGWTVATDQTSGIKTNDLLWAGTATTYATYNHDASSRMGLRIPYTHAMSKVTVVLVAGSGFVGDNLAGSAIALKNMNTVCKVNAANSSLGKEQITECGTPEDITMFKHDANGSITVAGATKPTRSFEAIVVPNKVWAKDNAIATITGMDGNTYNITATEGIIKQFLGKSTYDAADKVTLEPGKNYKLTITVDKQPQNIVAEITNWENIEATGVGTIQFAADVVSHNMTTDNVQGSFDLWRSTATTPDHESFDEDSNAGNGVTKATTVTYSGGKWTNSPEIYWANGSQNYFFRALAKFVQVEEQKQIISNEDISSFDVTQGTDIVWGTTSKHTGTYTDTDGTSKTKDYDEGTAINPRTGTVPMTFKHAMSKISVKLETFTGADAVNLDEAKISIANIYNGGTIDLYTGKIGDLTATTILPIEGFLHADDAHEGNKLKEYVVVPQSLITMKDGTTARSGSVSFYNAAELTEIGGEYYDTSTLDQDFYTEDDANTYNKELIDAVSVNSDMSYTEAQFKALTNSEIPEDLFKLFNFGCTYEEFVQKEEKPFMTYSNEDYETILTIYTKKGCKHNERSANAYNAKLPGAKHTGDLKGYKLKPDNASKKANPGDLKINEDNPKIMMLITLADGTTYKLDMASCKDGNEDIVTAWERGKHYTYTISLQKEKISFRAMIKDWEEKKTSGNATLEWD